MLWLTKDIAALCGGHVVLRADVPLGVECVPCVWCRILSCCCLKAPLLCLLDARCSKACDYKHVKIGGHVPLTTCVCVCVSVRVCVCVSVRVCVCVCEREKERERERERERDREREIERERGIERERE